MSMPRSLSAARRGATYISQPIIGFFIKIYRPVHDAVIRHRDCALTELLYARDQPLDTAGAVEQRVFAVYVKMDERHEYAPIFGENYSVIAVDIFVRLLYTKKTRFSTKNDRVRAAVNDKPEGSCV